MKATHFVNGKFVSEKQLLISPRDLGLIRGYAVGDSLVTNNHKPLYLSEHIDRLLKSAQLIELKVPWSKKQIAQWINQTLDKNDKKTEKSLKTIITGGKSHTMYQEESPTIIIIVDQYIPFPQSYYKNGVKVKAIKYKRSYPESKTTNYVEGVKQLAKAKKDNISEVIFYDDSQVFEGAGSNIFAVINNKLITTKSNILYGITRNTLLEILKLDVPVEEKNFKFEELLKASEVFLTGSGKGIRGVTHINGKAVGNGKVGKISKEAYRQYNEHLSK